MLSSKQLAYKFLLRKNTAKNIFYVNKSEGDFYVDEDSIYASTMNLAFKIISYFTIHSYRSRNKEKICDYRTIVIYRNPFAIGWVNFNI